MKESLRKIEEALKAVESVRWDDLYDTEKDALEKLQQGKHALASLRSLLESDAGQDVEEFESILITTINRISEEDMLIGEHLRRCLVLLSRLSAKAKIGEAQIREAKREVLEEIKDAIISKQNDARYFTGEWSHKEWILVSKGMNVVLNLVNEKLAAIKEAER